MANVTSLEENEAPYSESIEIKLQFVDVSDEPIFDPTSWNPTIKEANASLITPINDHKAFYPNLDDSDDDLPSELFLMFYSSFLLYKTLIIRLRDFNFFVTVYEHVFNLKKYSISMYQNSIIGFYGIS